MYVVERRGRDVAVIEGFEPKPTAALLDALFQAKQAEIKPPEPQKDTAAPVTSPK